MLPRRGVRPTREVDVTAVASRDSATAKPVLVASDLGFPEGPVVMPDGSFVCVDSYRGQLTIIGVDGAPRHLASTGGAPNSCVLGANGIFYVCQNGGTTGPWRAEKMIEPSIQVVAPGGEAEALVTEVEGVKLNGPNDLCFAADGSLVFSDPGTYNPADPDPSFIHRILPDGSAKILVAFPKPVFPNGVTVEADGSILWDETYTGHVGRIRPDGAIEDLGRPVEGPCILDGLKVGTDGRIYVADFIGKGVHVLAPDGKRVDFLPCGEAVTNCVFGGEALWITDVGIRVWATGLRSGHRALKEGSGAGARLLAGIQHAGLFLPASGRLRECRAGLQEIHTADSERSQSIRLVRGAIVKNGEVAKSIEQYRKALTIDPHFVPSHFGISADLTYMGKPDEANAELQKMTEEARNDGELRIALFGMAVVASDGGKWDKAVQAMDKEFAVAEKKNDVAAMAADLQAKGNIIAEAGKYDLAAQQFDRSFEMVQGSSLSQEIKDNSKLLHHFNLAALAIGKKDMRLRSLIPMNTVRGQGLEESGPGEAGP